MKRSEMLHKIIQLLVLTKTNDLGYKETAEEVLNGVRMWGMLPPLSFHNSISGDHSWEQEDDEDNTQPWNPDRQSGAV